LHLLRNRYKSDLMYKNKRAIGSGVSVSTNTTANNNGEAYLGHPSLLHDVIQQVMTKVEFQSSRPMKKDVTR